MRKDYKKMKNDEINFQVRLAIINYSYMASSSLPREMFSFKVIITQKRPSLALKVIDMPANAENSGVRRHNTFIKGNL